MKSPPLIPAWLLLATFAAIGLAMCVTLQGCATTEGWTRSHAPSAKPWLYVTVQDVDRTCREIGADLQRRLGRINGCATWQPQGCVIYLPENAPRWLLAHEERHCQGWTHP